MRTAQVQVVDEVAQIRTDRLPRTRPCAANSRSAVAAQVGQDAAIAGSQGGRQRAPLELAGGGGAVDEQYRLRSVTDNGVRQRQAIMFVGEPAPVHRWSVMMSFK